MWALGCVMAELLTGRLLFTLSETAEEHYLDLLDLRDCDVASKDSPAFGGLREGADGGGGAGAPGEEKGWSRVRGREEEAWEPRGREEKKRGREEEKHGVEGRIRAEGREAAPGGRK
uniref:Protein kinase domain-containing protein n=1 Tax=Oryza brachyantha TaxID=4533 RepID=J3N0Z0_ORYBR